MARDINGILALHEREAGLVNFDGSVARGKPAIRDAYVEFFAANPDLQATTVQIIEAGGRRDLFGNVRLRTAIITGTYTLEQDAADGGRETFTGRFADIVQQQADGSWKYVLDNPYAP